jgi:hypothetical protein
MSALGVFLGVCAAISMAAPVQAQLGGLMRKAKEAAKEKTAEKDPRTPESSGPNPFADPAIVFITQDQLGRFEKALQHEVTERAALRKQLASLPTREQYQACSQGAAMSPEMMKLTQDMAESSVNLPADQAFKRQQQWMADMAALQEKKCGIDPQKVESSRYERLRQIEAEASDIAMPAGYKAPPQARSESEKSDWAAMWNDAPARTPVAMKVRDSRSPSLGEAPAAARAQAATARPFARAYGMLKERVPVFCQALSEKATLTPTTITVGKEKMSVVKIRQKGSLDYVFRQDEADALTKGCSGVMALMHTIFDDVQKQ